MQGTYKWYVRGRGNKDQHEAFHGYAVCISLILGSTLQSYPWYIAVLVGMVTSADWRYNWTIWFSDMTIELAYETTEHRSVILGSLEDGMRDESL